MKITQRFLAPNKFNLHISCRAMVYPGGLAGLVAKCKTKNLCEPMRNTVILILLLSLLSCDKEVYHNIPKNEKPLLKNNDTVAFMERESNVLDSFLINRTDDYTVSDKRYYQEYIILSYHKIGDNYSFEKFFVQHSANTNISIEGNYFPTYGNADPVDVTVNGIEYKSVFVRHAVNFSDSIPNTVYYSHQYGIIKYTYSDGRSYELINNIE